MKAWLPGPIWCSIRSWSPADSRSAWRRRASGERGYIMRQEDTILKSASFSPM